jgi:uncharacterized protein YqfA (UPF0365 family)
MAEYGIFIWVAACLVGFWLILYFIPIPLWISAVFSGVRVNLLTLVIMRFRRVPPLLIVQSLVLASKAGIKGITTDLLETHYLAKGNLKGVIKALIVADKANLELSFKHATAIDLAGRDVLRAVQLSVTPYMIIVPSVVGVSIEGIQLLAEVRVTVRTNIQQLVGGAGEETIKARVGQGIISAIGKAKNYQEILGSPDHISKEVLGNGLDAGTAYTILSIDIADINVGKNIGAILQIDQANADLNIAQAKAGERRSMAIALEQEMIAKAQQARAQVIEALAQIPMALAGAYRTGTLFGKRVEK